MSVKINTKENVHLVCFKVNLAVITKHDYVQKDNQNGSIGQLLSLKLYSILIIINYLHARKGFNEHLV
jgi:hypothetical protein